LGFEAIAAYAEACTGVNGYVVLVSRINEIVVSTAPSLRHRWGQYVSTEDRGSSCLIPTTSKYSGLRHQSCTCYMNSVSQQLFMMPKIRESISSVTISLRLRSSDFGLMAKSANLIGKSISFHWDSSVSDDATVESSNNNTGMHTIRYVPLQVSSVNNKYGNARGSAGHQVSIRQDNILRLSQEISDKFVLCEGRPGKETGSFEVITVPSNGAGESRSMDDKGISAGDNSGGKPLVADNCLLDNKEIDNEALYRRLLEEVQRTFIHLDKGVRGCVGDPRSLVEASGCLRLEFDVWHQNDVLLHLPSTNQYTPTNNQKNEAPLTTSPVTSPTASPNRVPPTTSPTTSLMASPNEVPPTASSAASTIASSNETPPTTSPVASPIESLNEELPTAFSNEAPTIAPNNTAVLTYNTTNINDSVYYRNKVKRNPNPYLCESTDPDNISLLWDDHSKFLFEPQSDTCYLIHVIVTNTSGIPPSAAVISVMITPPLQGRIDLVRPFISQLGSCGGSPPPRRSSRNRSAVVACGLRSVWAHKLVQPVCRGPEPLETVY